MYMYLHTVLDCASYYKILHAPAARDSHGCMSLLLTKTAIVVFFLYFFLKVPLIVDIVRCAVLRISKIYTRRRIPAEVRIEL